MLKIRHNNERGLTQTDWLHGLHSFSFGEYRDRHNMGFGPLRVINEDVVAPGGGFHTHGHANMEILTYVLEGALEHKDSLGSGGVIRPGDVQVMSAGKGILHSEFNASQEEPVHLLQIWILPAETGTRPSYQQETIPAGHVDNRFGVLASPDGREGGLKIGQDAVISAAKLDAGKSVTVDTVADRKYWLQMARGKVTMGDITLDAGDGLAVSGEAQQFLLTADQDSEILLFNMVQ